MLAGGLYVPQSSVSTELGLVLWPNISDLKAALKLHQLSAVPRVQSGSQESALHRQAPATLVMLEAKRLHGILGSGAFIAVCR